ncbi:MAG: hypothetical protein Q9165_005981 [Trypethelium subeluteriae]
MIIITDSLNSVVTAGSSTAKDQTSQLANEIQNQDDLTTLSYNWTSKLMDTIETHVLEIQNGSLPSNDALNATLYNGAMLGFTSATSTMEDMREAAVQTILSQLIVPAWSLVADAVNVGNIHPTIIEGQFQIPQDPIGSDPQHASQDNSAWEMTDGDADASRVCLE